MKTKTFVNSHGYTQKNVVGSITKIFCGLSPVWGHLQSSWTLSNQTTWDIFTLLTLISDHVQTRPQNVALPIYQTHLT